MISKASAAAAITSYRMALFTTKKHNCTLRWQVVGVMVGAAGVTIG